MESAPTPGRQKRVRHVLREALDPRVLSLGQIETLQALARDDEPAERIAALFALGRLAKPSEGQALSTVVFALQDPEAEVRRAAARVLVGWSNRAVPALVQALREADNVALRRRIVTLLGQFGPNARAALPCLRSLEADPQVGDLVKDVLPRLQIGLGPFGSWLGLAAQDWLVTAIFAFVAIWGVLEIGVSARGGVPAELRGKVEGNGMPRLIFVGLGLAAAAAFRFGAAMLRHEAPQQKQKEERTFQPLLLLGAAVCLAILLAVMETRLEQALRG